MSAARLAAAAVGGGDLGVGRLAAGLQRTNLSQFNPRHDLAHDGRWGNVVTVNGTRGTTLAVKAASVSASGSSTSPRVFAPDFAGLDARVIAVDGMYAARPLDPAGYELAPGNRLDIDLTIPASLRGKRVPITDHFSTRKAPLR